MNNSILDNYGVKFYKLNNGNFKIVANSKNLAIYIDKYTRQKSSLQELISTLNSVLAGNQIQDNDKEWTVELGLQMYTGIIIQDNMTFDLFLEDHYNETLKTFPLLDIKEIFQSLLDFIS